MPRQVLGESLYEFIDDYVESFVGWDVVVLFFHNSNLKGDVDKIASFLGRKPEALREVLDRLVEKGLIKSESVGGIKTYFYKPNYKLASQVSDFVKALESREKRLAILTILLEKTH